MPQNFLKGSKHALIPGTPRRGAWHGADTPANSSEIRFCDPKHRIWSNISATGGGPRVDGFAFATDDIGLGVLLRKGTVFQMFQDQREAVNVGEYGKCVSAIIGRLRRISHGPWEGRWMRLSAREQWAAYHHTISTSLPHC